MLRIFEFQLSTLEVPSLRSSCTCFFEEIARSLFFGECFLSRVCVGIVNHVSQSISNPFVVSNNSRMLVDVHYINGDWSLRRTLIWLGFIVVCYSSLHGVFVQNGLLVNFDGNPEEWGRLPRSAISYKHPLFTSNLLIFLSSRTSHRRHAGWKGGLKDRLICVPSSHVCGLVRLNCGYGKLDNFHTWIAV